MVECASKTLVLDFCHLAILLWLWGRVVETDLALAERNEIIRGVLLKKVSVLYSELLQVKDNQHMQR